MYKIPDPPTSPSLISLNGFCGRKTPCFKVHICLTPQHVLLQSPLMVTRGQDTARLSPSLSRSNTWPLSSSWNPSANLALAFEPWRHPPSDAVLTPAILPISGRLAEKRKKEWTPVSLSKFKNFWRKIDYYILLLMVLRNTFDLTRVLLTPLICWCLREMFSYLLPQGFFHCICHQFVHQSTRWLCGLRHAGTDGACPEWTNRKRRSIR